jgi:hypothetical protein
MLDTNTLPGFAQNPIPSGRPPLPGFSRVAICPVCLGEEIRVDYCPGGAPRVTSDSRLCHADGVLDEHFHRTCTSCGRVWYEGMLSALAN